MTRRLTISNRLRSIKPVDVQYTAYIKKQSTSPYFISQKRDFKRYKQKKLFFCAQKLSSVPAFPAVSALRKALRQPPPSRADTPAQKNEPIYGPCQLIFQRRFR